MTDSICDGIRFTPMLNFNDLFQCKSSTWDRSESNDWIICTHGVGERAAKERDSEEASVPSGDKNVGGAASTDSNEGGFFIRVGNL